MKKWIRKIIDWLFPLSCLGCGKEDSAGCQECLGLLRLKDQQDCPGCRRNSIDGIVCSDCRGLNLVKNLDGLMVLFDYDKQGLLAKTLHAYKYDQIAAYGETLTMIVRRGIRGDCQEWLNQRAELVTWVPMTRDKRRARGFNQGEELARAIWGWGVQELAVKVRGSRAQMELGRLERLKNLKSAFQIKPDALDLLQNRSVVIVDDIATTLATLEELAGVLKLAGAAKVFGLTMARQKR